MAQFDIYKKSGNGIEYLIDLQDDLLSNLSTRAVAPLVSPDRLGQNIKTLNPQIMINGAPFILLTHLLAAIPAAALGAPVGSALSDRDRIIAAIDLLFSGI